MCIVYSNHQLWAYKTCSIFSYLSLNIATHLMNITVINRFLTQLRMSVGKFNINNMTKAVCLLFKIVVVML